ncbi:hypothetical protein ACPYO6_01820 [Georgenia sp. Z1344]|uniref:hypothetical protein n=1 Tax=Georgenia sp. Z1344 TaxID=3416706 RepID=UPI003CF0ABFC
MFYYKKFNKSKFRKRVREFWELNIPDDFDNPLARISEVVRFGGTALYPFSWDEFEPGTTFWRVRRMELQDIRDSLSANDLWMPPRKFAAAGRMNRHGEPLLYTTMGSPSGSFAEARVAEGDPFLLIRYEISNTVELKRVGVSNHDPELPRTYQMFEREVSAFLNDVMSIREDRFGPGVYAITADLLEALFSLELQQAGWVYNSTLIPNARNAAFTPVFAQATLTPTTVFGGISGTQGDMSPEISIRYAAPVTYLHAKRVPIADMQVKHWLPIESAVREASAVLESLIDWVFD